MISRPGFRAAIEKALGLDHLWVVYPGEHRYPLAPGLTVVPLAQFPAELISDSRVG